jgi:Putative peptidoglycan binding domain
VSAIVALLVLLVVVAVIVLAQPFGSSHRASGSTSDNAVATSLATVERRSLSAQQNENGTLGYAGSYTVINQAGAGSGGGGHGSEKGGGGGASSTITSLPAVGQVVGGGQALYDVNGEPVVLLYGVTPAYRTLSRGISGKDVAQLNSDLIALGYAGGEEVGEHPEYFGAETERAVKGLQEKLGASKSGKLTLGQAVFAPSGALRVTKVMGTLGGAAQQGGPLLEASSTRRQVLVKLDAAEQASVKQGDRVTITLPNNQTTAGVVSSVGKVAKSSSSGGRGGGEEEGTPTIEVQITPTNPAATGTLDQAPVKVAITTASVRNALVVPVSALVALAEGGYAVEVSEGRYHHLAGVTLGLFDDAEGKVEVSGAGLRAGEQVVVPST